MIVTGLERSQGVVEHAGILAAEALADELLQFRHVQIENPGHQAQGEDVLPFVLGRAANRLDRQTRNRNAHMMIVRLPLRFGLDVVGIVKHDPPLLQRPDVLFIRMLIKRQQHIGLVARAQHFARADAHLEN